MIDLFCEADRHGECMASNCACERAYQARAVEVLRVRVWKAIYARIFGQGLAYRGANWYALAEWVKARWMRIIAS